MASLSKPSKSSQSSSSSSTSSRSPKSPKSSISSRSSRSTKSSHNLIDPTASPPSRPSPSSTSSARHAPRSHQHDKVLASPLSIDSSVEDGDNMSDSDIESLWTELQEKENRGGMIVAVVRPSQVKEVKEVLKKRQRGSDNKDKLSSPVFVTTAADLQQIIKAKLSKAFHTLRILVANGVDSITYNIPDVVKNVYVSCCTSQRPDKLYIGASSTYCGVRANSWDLRGQEIRDDNYKIIHEDGCYFDLPERYADILCSQPTIGSNMSQEDLAMLHEHVAGFYKDVAAGPSDLKSEASQGQPQPSPCANVTEANWFDRWKSLLAVIIGIGAGCAAAGGVFWCSAKGIFISSAKFTLVAGSVKAGAAGAACMAGVGTGIAAAAIVYLIPWDKVFGYLKKLLWGIWEFVRDVFVWVWDKIKGMAGYIVTGVTSVFTS